MSHHEPRCPHNKTAVEHCEYCDAPKAPPLCPQELERTFHAHMLKGGHSKYGRANND